MINDFRGEYAFLSNFYEAPVVYMGIRYKNNEAAFQAQKALNLEARLPFTKMNPSEAKAAGRKLQLRDDWENVKIQIMYEICDSKFYHNPDLAKKLLATGNEHLEEGNTWGDVFWGTVNGQGSNWLGKILMRVREELRQGNQFHPVKITETRTKTVYVPAETTDAAAEFAHRLYCLGCIDMDNAAVSSEASFSYGQQNIDMFRYEMAGEKYDKDGDRIIVRAD